MSNTLQNTVLLICDVWDNHYCADLRRRTESLVKRINSFAKIVRKHGGRVLHCPSETVDSYYSSWPQRKAMKRFPKVLSRVHNKIWEVETPLDTTYTTGCPDIPTCAVHTDYTKQHEGIEILPEDLISDDAQEIYNLVKHKPTNVLMAGTALNMCLLGRPFGIQALVKWRVPVQVVADLVEVFYSSWEPPFITIEEAKWYTLGFIRAKWCDVTTTYNETQKIPEEKNMQIRTNLPGAVLAQLKRKYNLSYFVETGTAHGDTTELAAMIFDKVWSCDIDPRLVAKSKQRLARYDNVEITTEPSPKFLQRIKPQLTKPVLYWLDGHWCGGPVRPAKECPLMEELEMIGTFFQAGTPSVILIDDINLLMEPPPPPHIPEQWPTMYDFQAVMNAWNEPYAVEYHQENSTQVLLVRPKEEGDE